jgi:glycosyltransferase involved in cell wall biosynthesis
MEKGQIDICLVDDSAIVYAAQVRRQAASLAANGWNVLIVGLCRTPMAVPVDETTEAGFRIHRVMVTSRLPFLRGKPDWWLRTVIGFWVAGRYLHGLNARAYQASDFPSLIMMGLAGIGRHPTVYDSHELYFERPLPKLTGSLQFILRHLERYLARRSAKIIVTNESHARYFVENFAVPPPVIVRNAADLRLPEAEPVKIETKARYLVAHSGWLMHGRHLDQLVNALQFLPEEIAVALIGDGPLRGELEALADRLGVRNRLIITGQVKPDQMISTLKQASLAAMLIASEHLTYRYALPNKFFEAIAAGLPIISSPNPEIKRLVEHYDIGILCDPNDPHAVAQAIVDVLKPDNFERMKANVLRARNELNWETEELKLIRLYEELLGPKVSEREAPL